MGFFAGSVDLTSPGPIGSTTPNTGAFTTLSANNGTLTSSSPAFTLAQTWNSAGVTFTALQANITDTASASGSLLMDLQVGGVSRLSLTKNGLLTLYSGGAISVNSGGNFLRGLSIGADGLKGSSPATPAFLFWPSNNIIEQRNTTSAQTFRLYNTYTDASNYERGFFRWNTNVLELGTEAAGTGAARSLSFVSASNSYLFTVNSNASNAGANFTNNATNSYVAVFSATAPNLTSGQQAYFSVGRNAANNNWASFGFTYASNGSTSNRFDINFYGTSALFSILAGGNIGIGTTAPSVLLDVNSNTIRLRTARTPASASAAGDQGSICWDDSYIYVCTATNTWKRVAISTWP